jgi:hypothetical protein
MSEELQEEIDRLKAENRKLASDLADAQDELKSVRGEARDRRHEAKTLKEQIEALTKERDDFKVKAETDPEELRKTLAENEATIQALKHDQAFARVAKGLRVTDPMKYADLVKLAAYKPEGNEPDETKIAMAFQEALKGRTWLVDAVPADPAKPAPGGVGATQAQPSGKPGPGAERGVSVPTESSSQARDRVPGRL